MHISCVLGKWKMRIWPDVYSEMDTNSEVDTDVSKNGSIWWLTELTNPQGIDKLCSFYPKIIHTYS